MWKKLLPPVFAVLLIAPTVFFAYPNKSDAIVGCLASYLFNQGVNLLTGAALSQTKISTYDQAVEAQTSGTKANTQGALLKECILDITAKQIARAVLQSFTKSVVNWINKGFEGKPSFVTNPTGFLMDVADREFGREIRKIAPILCSPFRLNLQFALGLQYSLNTKEEVGCRLSDVIANARGSYDSFVSGDFRSGGWRNWVTITNTPQNNIYGAYLGAVGRLDASIISATGEEVKLLDFGQGFKSWRSCDDRAPDEKDKNGKVLRRGECTKPGKIKTPGSILMEQTSGTLQSSLRELEVADEIDEIFGALVNQLLIRTLGPGGLLGNSEPEPGGGPSYLDQLVNSPENAERLASIRPPEGINCNEEYEASGSADPVEQHRVMKVTYGRTNGKVIEIIAPKAATATTPATVPPAGVTQILQVEVWRGDALTSVGAATGLVHTVENRGAALAVGNIVSFEQFEGPETVFVGVQTIRFPNGAFHWNGTTYDTTRKLYRPAGKSWAEYFQQVRQGCRNEVNLYAEQINDKKTNEAATALGTTLGGGAPPPTPPAQTLTFEGNIAQGKLADQISIYVNNSQNYGPWNLVNARHFGDSVSGSAITYAAGGQKWFLIDLETEAQPNANSATTQGQVVSTEISEIKIFGPEGGWYGVRAHGAYDPGFPFRVYITTTDPRGKSQNELEDIANLAVVYRGWHYLSAESGKNDILYEAQYDIVKKEVSGEKRINSIKLNNFRGRFIYLLQNPAFLSGNYHFALTEVEVYGKQTRKNAQTGTTPPQNAPLAVWFTPRQQPMFVQQCTLGSCADFNRGEAITLPPDLPIEFHANKELNDVSLQARLFSGLLPTPTVPVAWKSYFNADSITQKSFKFSGGNSLAGFATLPFITIDAGGDQIINPVFCTNGDATTKIVPWVPCRNALLGGGKEQDVTAPIVFASGLKVTPEQPIRIGFEDALLPSSGIVGNTAVRILIEAVYTEGTTVKTLSFPVHFVIK